MPSLKTLLQLPCGWQLIRQTTGHDRVTIHLQATRKTSRWLIFAVRHWYCRNPSCSRKIFAESLAPFAGSRQQTLQLVQKLQYQLGLIAGEEAGQRAATAAGLRTSADSLLRRVIST